MTVAAYAEEDDDGVTRGREAQEQANARARDLEQRVAGARMRADRSEQTLAAFRSANAERLIEEREPAARDLAARLSRAGHELLEANRAYRALRSEVDSLVAAGGGERWVRKVQHVHHGPCWRPAAASRCLRRNPCTRSRCSASGRPRQRGSGGDTSGTSATARCSCAGASSHSCAGAAPSLRGDAPGPGRRVFVSPARPLTQRTGDPTLGDPAPASAYPSCPCACGGRGAPRAGGVQHRGHQQRRVAITTDMLDAPDVTDPAPSREG